MYQSNDNRAPFPTPIRQTDISTYVVDIDGTEFVLSDDDKIKILSTAKLLCQKQKDFRRFPYFENGHTYDNIKIKLSDWLARDYNLSQSILVRLYNVLFVKDPLSEKGVYFGDTVVAKYAVTVCSNLQYEVDDIHIVQWYEGLAEHKANWLETRQKAYDEVQLKKKIFKYFSIERFNGDKYVHSWSAIGIDDRWMKLHFKEITNYVFAFGRVYFEWLEDAVKVSKEFERASGDFIRVVDGDITCYYTTKGSPTLKAVDFSDYLNILSNKFDSIKDSFFPNTTSQTSETYNDFLLRTNFPHRNSVYFGRKKEK